MQNSTLLSIIVLGVFTSLNTYALCGNDEITLGVILTNKTSSNAYADGKSIFTSGDLVQVFERTTKKSIVLATGMLEDDEAGNYTVQAANATGQSIYVFHDHETWRDGISGFYISSYGRKIDLATIKCSYENLFLIH